MSEGQSSIFADTTVGALIRTDRPRDALADLLVAVGWQVATLAAVPDEATFHRDIAAALGFGAHYGANLDALWDCLSELTEPTALVWHGWADLAVGEPRQWARVLGVLRDRTEANPAFAVVLEGS